MSRILLILVAILSVNLSFGQHLYPEKFEGCNTSRFCLDCGDSKAEPPTEFGNELLSNLNKKYLKKISGTIEVQILIDTIGKPCLLSAKNGSNIKSKKLKLQNGINNTSNWKPAISDGKPKQSSVSMVIIFKEGTYSIQRRTFDFKNNSNFKSTGTPDVKGTKESKLSETWTVFNQSNSDLPWDMSRAAVASKDAIWIGTDNGLVKVIGTEMKVFDVNNSDIKPVKYNKNKASSIRYASVDKEDNIWLIAGWDAYKYNGNEWTIFDSINSPVDWARKIYVDNSNNVWFTSWDGVLKYDGNKWSVIDTSNSKLPSNKISGVFVDSQNRLWIGTYSGNIRIDNGKTIEFNNLDSPLKEGSISQMYEDKKGNLWFDLYNDDDKSKAGMFLLKANGEWETIKPKNSELFKENDINDFLLDEQNNILWIALNSVGLIRYDITNDKWETYTNLNSNVPSIHVMQLTQDKNGIIWAATFAGIIKLNKK
jgi:ligand-binding sensor domain-containing protein